jgi:hypothetical protein
MEKKFYQSKEFKELEKKWEEKLEHEGLPDIEKTLGQNRALKQHSSNVYRQMEETRREAKELYFRQLGMAIHQARFDTEIDRIVMNLKAEGATIVEICRFLRSAGSPRYRRTIRLIVRKYEDRWGIRNWSPSQLKYSWKKKPPTQ